MFFPLILLHYGSRERGFLSVSHSGLRIFGAFWGLWMFEWGGEPVIRSVPVQIIGRNPVPSHRLILPPTCVQRVPNKPEDTYAGFNGILGVAPQKYDNGFTYICKESRCFLWAPQPSFRVPNPVMLLPVDNNGIVLSFPQVPMEGSGPISGEIRFGIWTRTNNQIPSDTTIYRLDGAGYFRAFVNHSWIPVKADSGTNFFLVPFLPSQFPSCPQPIPSFVCPSRPSFFPLVLRGAGESSVGFINLPVGDARVLLTKKQIVIPGILLRGKIFQFPVIGLGLPFFLGRSVYILYQDDLRAAGIGYQ